MYNYTSLLTFNYTQGEHVLILLVLDKFIQRLQASRVCKYTQIKEQTSQYPGVTSLNYNHKTAYKITHQLHIHDLTTLIF